MSSRPLFLPLAAVAVTIMSWASAFVAIRYLASDLSAGSLALGRVGVAAVVLALILGVQRSRVQVERRVPLLPSRTAWPRLLICGIGWFAVYHVALNQGLHYIDAGTGSMLTNLGPILIAILAGLLLGEGFPRRLLVGIGVSFGGVLIIAASSGGRFDLSWAGILLCLLAAVMYAVGAITQKPLLVSLPALQLTTWCCLIGAVVCLPFLPALVNEVSSAGFTTIFWLLYLGVVPTALAFTTWAYALTHLTAGRTGSFTYLIIPVTIAISWLTLGEVPTSLAIGGGVLCVLGVYLARQGQPRLR